MDGVRPGEPQITAVILTTGEDTFERAKESVLRQTHAVADIVVVRNVRPFHKAVNTGASRVKTPFFVQVDSDMIFDEDCFASLISRFEDHVGIVCCHLRDALMGRVEAIKMYRTDCFQDLGLPDSISPDTDFHDTLARSGRALIYALRYDDRDEEHYHTFGEHRPEYTDFFGYARHTLDGRRIRYRANAAALRHHLHVLHHSAHPAGLASHVGLAQGVFLPGEDDLLSEYSVDKEFERLEAFLARTGPARRRGASLPRWPALSARTAFEYWLGRGMKIMRDGNRADLERALGRLHGTPHPWAWLMQLGVCRGLFYDHLDAASVDRDWAMLSPFAYYYQGPDVATRWARELRAREARLRGNVRARVKGFVRERGLARRGR